jgi:hypothetical protein
MSFEEMQSILQGILLSQQQMQSTVDRAIQIAESNGRAIQAMLDNAATDRLDEKERAQRHEERVRLHEEEMQQLNLHSAG